MPRTIVVVPCYNEARRLDLPAFEHYGRAVGAARLLLVNDGSPDATGELLDELERRNPQRFGCLQLAQNGGKAEAVRQGMLAAIARGADYVGFWDADLATPLTDIDRFARVLDEMPHLTMVVGTRIRLLGRRIERRPLRYYLGRGFAQAASLALGLRIFDTQCGAKLFRVTRQFDQSLARPFLSRWIFDVELLARLKLAARGAPPLALDETIYEYPLDVWRDVAGSKVKSGDFLKAAVELSRIYWAYLRPGATASLPNLPESTGPAPHAQPTQQQKAA